MDLDGFTLEEDLTFIEMGGAGDRLDEGRLACTVIADQGQDLPGEELKVDLVQSPNRPEIF
jgi:hypothetical protein